MYTCLLNVIKQKTQTSRPFPSVQLSFTEQEIRKWVLVVLLIGPRGWPWWTVHIRVTPSHSDPHCVSEQGHWLTQTPLVPRPQASVSLPDQCQALCPLPVLCSRCAPSLRSFPHTLLWWLCPGLCHAPAVSSTCLYPGTIKPLPYRATSEHSRDRVITPLQDPAFCA